MNGSLEKAAYVREFRSLLRSSLRRNLSEYNKSLCANGGLAGKVVVSQFCHLIIAGIHTLTFDLFMRRS